MSPVYPQESPLAHCTNTSQLGSSDQDIERETELNMSHLDISAHITIRSQ
jgi:hypothetical protein